MTQRVRTVKTELKDVEARARAVEDDARYNICDRFSNYFVCRLIDSSMQCDITEVDLFVSRERAQTIVSDAIARSGQLDARERDLAGLAAVLDGR